MKSNRIIVEPITDNQVNEFVANSNKVIVGTDTILSDDSLINGKPTLRLAKAANDYAVPFYVICELNKFNTPYRAFLVLGDNFDQVPPTHIMIAITELGIMKPNEVKNFINNTRKIF